MRINAHYKLNPELSQLDFQAPVSLLQINAHYHRDHATEQHAQETQTVHGGVETAGSGAVFHIFSCAQIYEEEDTCVI